MASVNTPRCTYTLSTIRMLQGLTQCCSLFPSPALVVFGVRLGQEIEQKRRAGILMNVATLHGLARLLAALRGERGLLTTGRSTDDARLLLRTAAAARVASRESVR